MRILHVITSLGTGGAEIMLQKLIRALAPQKYNVSVISLTSISTIGAELRREGVPVQALGGRGGVLLPHQLWTLARAYRSARPDIVHSWMYHANVAAEVLVRLTAASARPCLITSVRGAIHAPLQQKRLSRLVRRIDASLSSIADHIVFNSRRSVEQHVALGYDEKKIRVIPNSFDTNVFQPMPSERASIRQELGCGDGLLVGLIARFHPLKDHRTFLEAASLVAQRQPNCRFLLVGRGCDARNQQLVGWIHELNLSDRVITLGERRDVAAIDNALDIAVCASMSESFPNAIGEAMACGVPCVVTDVGDCSYLVGDTRCVVPARNPQALAEAILHLASLPPDARAALGASARARVLSEFSTNRIVELFVELYEECVARSE
jgi:glycosyltransferase involved in cell wall biosynthesis